MISYGQAEMDYISKQDPIMKKLVKKYGHMERGTTTDIFESLVYHIISQMLSNSSARTIIHRFQDLVEGQVKPSRVVLLTPEEIRSCGISKAKANYILLLSRAIIDGTVSFSHFDTLTDTEIVNYLMTIKGVGKWTAEMIAAFTLGRLDIFCFEDVALCNGIKRAHGFDSLNTNTFNNLRDKYSPYCSIAALYYYALNDDKTISQG